MNNTGVIFKRTLRDSRKTIIGWGIGLAIYIIYTVILYPFMQEFQQINEMLEIPFLQALIGTEITDLTSPSGFLGIYFFTYAPLLLAVFAILFGMGITSSEEDSGILDILLATPVARWQLILEKFAAAIVIVLLLLLWMLAGFALALLVTPVLQVDWLVLLLAFLNVVPITLLLIALTLLLSTIFRSRGLVGGIMTAFLVASYFLKTLAEMASEPLNNMRFLSIFNYYGGPTIMTTGIPWGGFLLLSLITIVLVGLSVVMFQRRDLGT